MRMAKIRIISMKREILILYLLIFFGLILNLGCGKQQAASVKTPRVLSIKKVVAVGFLSAMTEKDKPGSFHNPLSGSMVTAEPISPDVVRAASDTLFERIVSEKNFELVSRGQAMGAYSSIIRSDKNVGMPQIQVVQEVGRQFNADAVLIGYIYRWSEREGTDYGIKRAASVSFDLHLIRSFNGAIMWKYKFDKTQQSLTENLFDLGTFTESGGKWLTVDKLAAIGFNKMLKDMPSGEGGAE